MINNDKPRFKIWDICNDEYIYCEKITGTELSWIYIHYVVMDNTVVLVNYHNEDEYLTESFYKMLRGIYQLGID